LKFIAIFCIDGPLEDADISDDESEYDWYTWDRCLYEFNKNNDIGAINAMKTLGKLKNNIFNL
jgi:hypothetical protein